MTTQTQTHAVLMESQKGPAERLLDVVLGSSAHLWHNRPGINVNGVWFARKGAKNPNAGAKVTPGLFVPAAIRLYTQLLEINKLSAELSAHFASYALKETDWRDLMVASTALMLVQKRSGQPIHEDDGSVAFYDDDYRSVGEAMLLHYAKKSARMITPKGVLRIAELLETPEIAALNRAAGFGDPAAKKAPLGRWKRAATRWLSIREKNLPMLSGLVRAGYKETIKKIARKCGYKPDSAAFFEVLGWKQKQAAGGHRSIGLTGLKLEKRERFDGLSEAEICEQIVDQKLSYKEVVGRLPKETGLTPAILAVLLPSLSDRDLRIMTPTLEELGLLQEPEIRERWERAIAESTDQRALNIAKNVKSKELQEKLSEASDNAAKKAVAEATKDADVHVMFLVDQSGSMQGAIEQSKAALAKILAGFPMEKLHIASFNTIGTVLRPKASSKAAVEHMLQTITAGGGTIHGTAVTALQTSGVRVPKDAKLIVLVVGDEAGEPGAQLARTFQTCGYDVCAIGMLVSVTNNLGRGTTVQECARTLNVPFTEVDVQSFDDPYQVPRVLKAMLDAPRLAAGVTRQTGWVERVLATPILTLPS